MIILKAGKQQKKGKTKAAAASLSSCDMRDSCSFLTFETMTVTNTCDEDMSRPSDQKTRYDAMRRDRNEKPKKKYLWNLFLVEGQDVRGNDIPRTSVPGKKGTFFFIRKYGTSWVSHRPIFMPTNSDLYSARNMSLYLMFQAWCAV